MKKIFILLLCGLVAACAPQEEANQLKNRILAFSWQPAFCERASGKRECKTQHKDRFDARHFTLHGLWPQPGNNIYCKIDEKQIAIDKKGNWKKLETSHISQPVWEQLKQVMPGTMSSLHKHEWIKHGTCYSDSIDEYYAHSIWLMKQINKSSLQKLFENNIGREISGATIRQAFSADFGKEAGKRLRISCRRDKNSNRQLITEITLGLAGTISQKADFSKLVMAASPTEPGCPKGIIDPVGLQ